MREAQALSRNHTFPGFRVSWLEFDLLRKRNPSKNRTDTAQQVHPVKNPDEDVVPDLDGPKPHRLLIHPHSSRKPAAVAEMMSFFALVY